MGESWKREAQDWEQASDKGRAYDERVDKLAGTGLDMHGEADLVEAFLPRQVLDAGCGTGRVAIELARRGMEVTGVDGDSSMLDRARSKSDAVEWILGDLAEAGDLAGIEVELALMAGNVMIFVAPGTESAVIANVAATICPGGVLIAGFQIVSGRIGLEAYDEACRRADLELSIRWSTWDKAPFAPSDTYAVSVHRRPLR
ncbi:MAG: class I SAM-dependent methyltransferase [Acidimicrobiales bacterium]